MICIFNVCYDFDNLKVSSNGTLKTRSILFLNEFHSFKMLHTLNNKNLSNA